MVHNHSNANKRTDFEHSYLLLFIYLFIYLFLDFYLTLPIHISLVTYLCLHTKKKQTNKQANRNSAKIHILHQDLNPQHRDVTLSDFNNYLKFYIIMSASDEFTIFVFSIY